jgi:uncharacterized protein YjiK
MNKLFIGLLVVAMAGLALFLFWTDIQTVFGNVEVAAAEQRPPKQKDENKKAKKKKDKDTQEPFSPIRIINRWELPSELTEISGLAFLSDGQVACVQDEEGKIFVYNLDSKNITKEVPFAGEGDYEGIAVVGSTAYVLRSDGMLLEVAGFTGSHPEVTQYRTPLTARQDVEGLAYDPGNQRLLLTIKGEERAGADYKGVYTFSLSSKRLEAAPVFKIRLDDQVFREETKKKVVIQPSDLSVHPFTGDLYIIDGARPKLLVMDSMGRLKKLYRLSTTDFPQPEGIGFNKEGELFISNEGRGGVGTILKVVLEDR